MESLTSDQLLDLMVEVLEAHDPRATDERMGIR